MTIPGATPSLLYPIASVYALVIAGLTIRKRELHQVSARMLVLFALTLAGTLALLSFKAGGWLNGLLPTVQDHLPLYGTLVLAWVLLGFSLAFLRTNGHSLAYWGAAFPLVFALFILDSNLPHLPDILYLGERVAVYRNLAGWYGVLAGWTALIFIASIVMLVKHQKTRHPLHRNRMKHLLPVLAVFSLGAALTFALQPVAGYAAYAACLLLMFNVALTHELPDLRNTFRQSLTYLIIIILSAASFSASYQGLSALLSTVPYANPVTIGAAICATLAILIYPLTRLVRKWVNRIFASRDVNPAQTVHDYGQQISNILDIEMLAAVAVGSIRDALGITRGHLLLVEKVEDDQQTGYRLKDIPIPGSEALTEGILSFDSPITAFLCREHRSLTQYDLDLLPEYQSAPRSEVEWFALSTMDVYIPITIHDEWIGLLAVGLKISGDRYSTQELILLQALAGQTAVSLENARLFKNLSELNEQLTQAYEDLNTANQQLEQLDRTKTDFINIASHELRTPLTLLLGYAEMLAGDQNLMEDPFYSQMISGIQTGTNRLHEIVASMLDMAKIDSRTLDLAPKGIALPSLIRDIQASLAKAMTERQLEFEMIELTSLPMIEADPEALQKVFYHLIINAVKFTPDGGKIKVMERVVPAHKSPLGRDSVEVIVSDTGIGIDAGMQELIFIKFYHSGPVDLHSSGKTKFKGGGPGLGLAIVRGIVAAHNGRVWVESPGSDEAACPGSQFHVLLPLSQRAGVEPVTIPVPERRQMAEAARS